MRTYLKFGWLLFLFVVPGIAQTDATHGPAIGLFNQCRVAVNPPGPGIAPPVYKCLNYIDGWLEGIDGTLISNDKGFLQTVTVEDGVTALQAAKVYVLYMNNHPEEENKPRQVALWHAMLNAGLVALVSPGKDKEK